MINCLLTEEKVLSTYACSQPCQAVGILCFFYPFPLVVVVWGGIGADMHSCTLLGLVVSHQLKKLLVGHTCDP